jgi:hypothetical protein
MVVSKMTGFEAKKVKCTLEGMQQAYVLVPHSGGMPVKFRILFVGCLASS